MKTGFRTKDADVIAFIKATGITDGTEFSAINYLVLDLKNKGLWTKINTLYPFVGGTATTHKYNLKDPRDDWLDWEEYMVWAPWLRDEKFYRVNNIPWTLLSAHERVMMGIYNPETKKSKDDGDKP